MNRALFASIAVLMLTNVGVISYDILLREAKNASPNSSLPATPAVLGLPSYTLAEVRAHPGATSCWAAVNGNVYDLTAWINRHPGGPKRILSICGTDGSAAFNGQHEGQARPAEELAGFKIGTLKE